MKITCATDDAYVLPLLVAIYSAKMNASKEFQLTIAYFPDELSQKKLELLTGALAIIDITFDLKELCLDQNMRTQHHITPTAYSRLLLADQLSGAVMWLDADTLSLPGWDSIFLDAANVPNGKTLSATRDSMISDKSLMNTRNQSILKMGKDYFNSGVVLIDCDRWKQLDFANQWPRLLVEGAERGFEYADQCVLNFMCMDEVNYISVVYNTLAINRRDDHRITPRILHFAGNIKPWHYSILNLRILIDVLLPKDVYKYLSYQSKLIKDVRRKDRVLGSRLMQERRLVRRKH